MVNGHAIAHGAFVFAVADTAFACACNSHGPVTVAAGADITFVAPGARGRRTRGRGDRAHPVRPQRHLRRDGATRRRGRRGVPRPEPHGRAERVMSLDLAERMSRDELTALQLERLQDSLLHAYENVPVLPRGVRRGRRAPGRLPDAGRPRALPLHHQGRPARQLPVRHVRRAAEPGAPHPRVERHHRAGPPSSATRRTTSTPGPI